MKSSKEFDLKITQYLRLLRFFLCRGKYQPDITFHSDISKDPSPASSMALFTAADSQYLRRHFGSYARSVATHMPGAWIHIHIYNSTEEDLAFLEALKLMLPALCITVSSQKFDPERYEKQSAASPQQSWRSLYICTSRFLAARRFQEESKKSILITDIDLLFNGDARARFGNGVDAAMFLRPNERNLCKRALGGVVFVAASSPGNQFLRRVTSDISRFLSAGYYWFAFDQLALYSAFRQMQTKPASLNFSKLDTRDMSFNFDPGSLLLVPKGKTRDHDAFAALAARYNSYTSNPRDPE